jgi:hypothetical protein
MKNNKFSYRHLIWIVVIAVVGILLVSISFAEGLSKFLQNSLRIVGQTLLSSSVFLGIVKSLQFTNYFQEALESIIFSEKFLGRLSREDIKSKWKSVTNILYSNFFPSLRDNLNNHILDKLIANNKNYYHKDMNVLLTITKFDNEHIKIIEHKSFRIIGNNQDNLDFKLVSRIEKTSDQNDKSCLELTRLELSDNNHLQFVSAPTKHVNKAGNEIISLEYEHKLGTKDECKVITGITSVHTTKFNVFWTVSFDTFVDSLTIDLQYDKNVLEADLVDFGQTIDLKNDVLTEYSIRKRCENLIFPKDCLILIVKFK